MLVTGGGLTDQTIKIWKTSTVTGSLQKLIPTGDQVCTLQWNPVHNELISASGFINSELAVWQYPDLQRITQLKFHTKHILYTAVSPDSTTVATASGDELPALWQINSQHRPASSHRQTTGSDESLLLEQLPESLYRQIR
jgi:WD40 repeat protein